jgi:phosphotransferase system HPr (HPr) family protein
VASRSSEAGAPRAAADPARPGAAADPTPPAGGAAEATAVLPADVDLHARPAAQFVRLALGFRARIVVAVGEREVDAKSLLSVLSLGAKRGTSLRLAADGDDAASAVEALAACVAGLRE